jgi:hypothetical protein
VRFLLGLGFFFVPFLNPVFAQNGGLSLQSQFHYGMVIPEYSSFLYLTEDYVHSIEVSLEKQTNGSNPWSELYNYPGFGISFFYTTLGNDEIHGHEFAVYPYFRIPLYQNEKLELATSIGLGLGYATKRYDPETNPLNVVVGSHFNVHFQAKLGIRYLLNEKWGLEAGLSLAHLSNANTAEPNIGINNGTAYAGIHYRLSPRGEPIRNIFDPVNKEWFFEVLLAPGFKSTRALRESHHFTLSLSADAWKPLSRIIAVGVGPDIFYDSSAETELSVLEKQYRAGMQWSTGIHGSLSIRYDRLRLILQAGVYLGLLNEVEDEPIYNRGILRYDVSERIFAHFAMKSHLHILDHPEFGIGIKW